MATWHPPIPASKLYSEPALKLGPALAMLIWCYDGVQRDGTVEVSLEKATEEIGKSYRTIKDWWRALREGSFFSEMRDCGRKGWVVRMADDWLDWHIMERNYPQLEGRKAALEEDVSRPGEGQHVALEDTQGPLKARSRPAQGRKAALEDPAYKVLMSDQESESIRERENHENAVGSLSLKNGTSEPKHLDPLALAIAETCRINPKIPTDKQRQQLNEAYKALKAIGASPEDIPVRVAWWEQNDWRAQKEPGRPITPKELQDVWEKVATPSRSPPKANAPPADNRPPLQLYQSQPLPKTDPAKFRAAIEEVARKKTNGNTS